MNIAYFITGHGYGHAVRSIAVMSHFSDNVSLFIRSAVPESFFRDELSRDFNFKSGRFDCGCLQKDSVSVDIKNTLNEYIKIADTNKTLLNKEVTWCIDNDIDLIVSDITPFAFEIAKSADIPSIAIGNFSWFDIYEPYVKDNKYFLPYLNEIKKQYSYADLLLRLYPYNRMSCFNKITEISLIGRAGTNCKAQVCESYGIPENKKLAYMYLGTFGININDWSQLEKFSDWYFIGTKPLDNYPENYVHISNEQFKYIDLCASVDLVISKIGYGIYSDCLLNKVPLMYLPRFDFIEFPVLESAIIEWGYAYSLDYHDFTYLSWGNILDKVKSSSSELPTISNESSKVAKIIEDFFD